MRAIAQRHEVWVITAAFHRSAIEKSLAEHPEQLARARFFYVAPKLWHYAPTPRWVRVERSCLKPVMNSAYRLWLRDAYDLGARLHRAIRFDLVHQLTYVGFRFPGELWKLDCPFVWGPIGGLENTPWRFLSLLGLYGGAYYATRNLLNDLDRRFRPAPKKAFAKARASGAVIAATPTIRELIQRFYHVESQVICEVCPPPQRAAGPTWRHDGEPLRLCWAGEHLPGKALPLLLTAAARLPRGMGWQLDILGDGPCRRKWSRRAETLRIQDRCHWLAKVPRAETIRLIHQAHVFVITSLKDLTSTVLLEALFQGVPVLCPDHCGFGHVVTPECGIKLPIASIPQFVEGLRQSIARLAADETLRRQLAAGALRRAQDFDWNRKIEQLNEIYDSVAPAPLTRTGQCLG